MKPAPLPAYRVVHSARKTIGLIVERDASLVVRAPLAATNEVIERAVRAKSLWIYDKTHNAPKASPDLPRKEFLNGETIMYLGRNYRLDISDDATQRGLRFRGKFTLCRKDREQAGVLFRNWYIDHGLEWIPKRAERFTVAMGAVPGGITVSEVSASWGSCSPGGVLNFNWRLMKAPPNVIDYVIVHELAHLLEPNHTKTFWTIIAVQVPNYRMCREWLVKNGEALEVDF